MNEIMFTGIRVDELLSQIGELIESKFKNLHPEEKDSLNKGYYTRKEVSAFLKISLPTLHEWTKLRWLKAYKIGSRVLYKKTEVEDALSKVTALKYKKGGMYEA